MHTENNEPDVEVIFDLHIVNNNIKHQTFTIANPKGRKAE